MIIELLRNLAVVALLASGVATHYGGETFEGKPLYCDQFIGEDYSLLFEEGSTPWVAFPIEWYETGKVECGQWVILAFENNTWQIAQALDAGAFGGAEVTIGIVQGPIVVDIPVHQAPFASELSAYVTVYSFTR